MNITEYSLESDRIASKARPRTDYITVAIDCEFLGLFQVPPKSIRGTVIASGYDGNGVNVGNIVLCRNYCNVSSDIIIVHHLDVMVVYDV